MVYLGFVENGARKLRRQKQTAALVLMLQHILLSTHLLLPGDIMTIEMKLVVKDKEDIKLIANKIDAVLDAANDLPPDRRKSVLLVLSDEKMNNDPFVPSTLHYYTFKKTKKGTIIINNSDFKKITDSSEGD